MWGVSLRLWNSSSSCIILDQVDEDLVNSLLDVLEMEDRVSRKLIKRTKRMAAGGSGEMEEEESAEDLSTVVKDWMKQNYIKGETEEEPDQVDVYENAIANPETDEEEMEEEAEEGEDGQPKPKCPKKKMLAHHKVKEGEVDEKTLEEYAAESVEADVAKMGFAGPGHFKERKKRAKKVAGPGSIPLPTEDEEEEEEEEVGTGESWATLKKKTRQPKKRPRNQEDSWDCDECTYTNNAKDYKCEMCFASKTTSKGRKARRDPSAVQERVQQELLQEELDKRVGYKEPVLPLISDVKTVFTDEEMRVIDTEKRDDHSNLSLAFE